MYKNGKRGRVGIEYIKVTIIMMAKPKGRFIVFLIEL